MYGNIAPIRPVNQDCHCDLYYGVNLDLIQVIKVDSIFKIII